MQPEQVFKPGAPVEPEMFTKREFADVQKRLINALKEEGRQLLEYGDTGVGKTSLLRIVANDLGLKWLSLDCRSEMTFDEMMQELLGALGVPSKTKTTAGGATRSEVEGGLTLFGVLRGGGSVSGEDTKAEEFQYEAASPARRVFEACRDAGIKLLVLDNFENVTDKRVRRAFAELIKFLADRSAEYKNLKLVIIGIAATAESLLTDDDATLRRTVQIEVQHMPIGELEDVLHKGSKLLDLRFADDAVPAIAQASDGFPYFTHLLGLHATRRTIDAGEKVVTLDFVRQAVNDAANEVKATIRTQVREAEERTGDVRPRTRILQVMADMPYEEGAAADWTSVQIIAAYEKRFGTVKDNSFLHVALAQLAPEERHGVLVRSGKAKSYTYRFRTPFTRPYLRMRAMAG